jgi:hypothetical protein
VAEAEEEATGLVPRAYSTVLAEPSASSSFAGVSVHRIPPSQRCGPRPARCAAAIYEFLEQRGHVAEGDAIVVHGWPVQFLPAESPLLTEAVQQAVPVDFEGVPTRVMTAEHLMAIALQTGRAKDIARLLAFLESGTVDEAALTAILNRHGLVDAWSRFKQNYLSKPRARSPPKSWSRNASAARRWRNCPTPRKCVSWKSSARPP